MRPTNVQDLVGRGVVEQTGSRRWTSYALTVLAAGQRSGSSRPTPLSPADASRRDIGGAGIRAENPLPKWLRRRDLGIDVTRRWLQVLREEGKVELIGKPQSTQARWRALLPAPDRAEQLKFLE